MVGVCFVLVSKELDQRLLSRGVGLRHELVATSVTSVSWAAGMVTREFVDSRDHPVPAASEAGRHFGAGFGVSSATTPNPVGSAATAASPARKISASDLTLFSMASFWPQNLA